MTTIGARSAQMYNHGEGFDWVRIAAAMLVLVSHAFPIATGSNDTEPLMVFSAGQLTLGTLAVGVFFASSGYLIAMSADRSRNVASFAWRRGLRILPALWAVVLISMFVLGPSMTTTLTAYFRDPILWRYSLNVILVAQYELPGVFVSAPHTGTVNGSLWTLIYEVASYCDLATMMFAARPVASLGIVLALAVCLAGSRIDLPGVLFHASALAKLFAYFAAGSALYLFRDRVPFSMGLAGVALIITMATFRFGLASYIAPIMIAYIAVFIGFQRAPTLPGDYSYGVYLWAFPTQQVVVTLLPDCGPWINIALSVPITLVLGIASWTLIEKPAMRFKDSKPWGGTWLPLRARRLGPPWRR